MPRPLTDYPPIQPQPQWLTDLEAKARDDLEADIRAARTLGVAPAQFRSEPPVAKQAEPKPDVAPKPARAASNTTVLTLRVVGDQSWRAQAACVGVDPDVFLPPIDGRPQDTEWQAEALTYCAECSVTDQCRDFALSMNERAGIWGGMTTSERARYRKEHGVRRWCPGCGRENADGLSSRSVCGSCVARRKAAAAQGTPWGTEKRSRKTKTGERVD
jgi:WhiB family redox-sensing transcriptional regulator